MWIEQLKYHVTSFRTKKTYLIFQILQLILSIVIIIVALNMKSHFKSIEVLILQYILFFSLAFDLQVIDYTSLVIRCISQGHLFVNKMNIFDLSILCIFAATLIFLTIFVENGSSSKDYRELLQTDDVIILVIVIGRYIVQVIRLIFVIKNTKINRQIHQEIKNIDLNAQENNLSTHFGQALKADKRAIQIMKNKHVILNQQQNL